MAMDSRNNNQPHWKELALLLSKKKQLNVVLRREVIPSVAASTSESSHSAQDATSNHSENVRNENNSVSDREDIAQTKEEFIAPEPSVCPPIESNAQESASGIRSGSHSPDINFIVQPTSDNTDETYDVSINDFKSLLMVATKRSNIRLSIEDTSFNLKTIDDQASTEHQEPSGSDLQSKRLGQNNIVMIATKNNKKRRDKIKKRKSAKTRDFVLPTIINQKSDQSVMQNTNPNRAEANDMTVEENKFPSKCVLEYSTIEKRKEEKQYIPKKKILRGRLRNEYKIQDEFEENEFDQNLEQFVLTRLEKKPKGKSIKRQMQKNDERSQDEDQGKQKQRKENNNEEDFSLSACKITKKFKEMPPTTDTHEESIKNALEIENKQNEISVEPNVDNNFNVVIDNVKLADGMPVKETGESECYKEEGPEEYVMDTETKKANQEPKSVAKELQLLRKRMIVVSRSQKQIQAALQSTQNDRFELFGKTIAAWLRELPNFESQSLEIKLLNVLLEDKRNYMILTRQSMCDHAGE